MVAFDPYSNTVKNRTPFHVPEKSLKGRKYYAGFHINDHYYIHGGLDTHNRPCEGMISINLDSFMWKEIMFESGSALGLKEGTCEKPPPFPKTCHGHKMCVVTYDR